MARPRDECWEALCNGAAFEITSVTAALRSPQDDDNWAKACRSRTVFLLCRMRERGSKRDGIELRQKDRRRKGQAQGGGLTHRTAGRRIAGPEAYAPKNIRSGWHDRRVVIGSGLRLDGSRGGTAHNGPKTSTPVAFRGNAEMSGKECLQVVDDQGDPCSPCIVNWPKTAGRTSLLFGRSCPR